jgi:hypothetical protein
VPSPIKFRKFHHRNSGTTASASLLTIIQGGLHLMGRRIQNIDATTPTWRMVRGRDMVIEGVRCALVRRRPIRRPSPPTPPSWL